MSCNNIYKLIKRNKRNDPTTKLNFAFQSCENTGQLDPFILSDFAIHLGQQ